MRIRSVLCVLGSTALLPTVAPAQDTPPQAYQVITLEHTPSTMVAWRNAQAQLAEAMKAANIPASEAGWWAYTRDNKTIIVRPRSRDALFGGGNPQARLRQADSAKGAQIAALFQGTQVRGISNEIIEHAPNLSYNPATEMANPGGVQVLEVRIAPGQGQAFNQAIQAINKVRTAVSYPYSVQLYRVRMGEPRTTIVTFFDTNEAFFGKSSLATLMEGKPALREEYQKAITAVLSAVSGWESWLGSYAPNLSYPPM